MKYVVLGRLDAAWAGKQSERVTKAQAKLKELGIELESIHSHVRRFKQQAHKFLA